MSDRLDASALPRLRAAWRAADNLTDQNYQGEQHMRRTALWQRVLDQQLEDALYVDPTPHRPINRKSPNDQKRAQLLIEKTAAIEWLLRGRSFAYVCRNAGLEPSVARASVRAYLEAHGIAAT